MENTDFESVLRTLRSGDESALEKMTTKHADFPCGNDAVIGNPWLLHAVNSGSVTSVKWIIKKCANVNFRTAEGITPLHASIDSSGSSKHEILRTLIAAGANVNEKGANDWTPLHMAASFNDLESVRILLEAGADATIRAEMDARLTAAEEADYFGKTEASRLIRDFEKSRSQQS